MSDNGWFVDLAAELSHTLLCFSQPRDGEVLDPTRALVAEFLTIETLFKSPKPWSAALVRRAYDQIMISDLFPCDRPPGRNAEATPDCFPESVGFELRVRNDYEAVELVTVSSLQFLLMNPEFA
jgi:hypothetical protein